jgi:uncharacterized protein YkwD
VAEAGTPSYHALLLQAINSARASHGQPPVHVDASLRRAARTQTVQLVRSQQLTHASPNGAGPVERVMRAGFHGRYVGENLAVGYGPRQCVEAWLGSAEHRDVLLSPRFTAIGIAVATGVYGSQTASYITADFGG